MPLVKEDQRALARIVQIDEIRPIKKADRIEVAVVGGWQVIVQKGLYQEGDYAVYFEIDAAIPADSPVWGDFDISKMLTRNDENDRPHIVIRTLKLKGIHSQGLLLRMQNLHSVPALLKIATASVSGNQQNVNITDELEVIKYVTPDEWKLYQARLAAADREHKRQATSWWWKKRMQLIEGIVVDGLQDFPRGHVRSSEDRLQNIGAKQYNKLRAQDDLWEASIKLNGESAMVYEDLDQTGLIGLAQRNFSLRMDAVPYTKQESRRVYLSDWMRYLARKIRFARCSFPRWKTHFDPCSVPLVKWMIDNGVVWRLKGLNATAARKELQGKAAFLNGKKVSVQGEMVGPSFAGGAEGFPADRFFVYRAYGNGNYKFTPAETKIVCELLQLEYIPVDTPSMLLPETMEQLIKMADGPSVSGNAPCREGLVMKNQVTGESMKVISNRWLEGQDVAEDEAA